MKSNFVIRSIILVAMLVGFATAERHNFKVVGNYSMVDDTFDEKVLTSSIEFIINSTISLGAGYEFFKSSCSRDCLNYYGVHYLYLPSVLIGKIFNISNYQIEILANIGWIYFKQTYWMDYDLVGLKQGREFTTGFRLNNLYFFNLKKLKIGTGLELKSQMSEQFIFFGFGIPIAVKF